MISVLGNPLGPHQWNIPLAAITLEWLNVCRIPNNQPTCPPGTIMQTFYQLLTYLWPAYYCDYMSVCDQRNSSQVYTLGLLPSNLPPKQIRPYHDMGRHCSDCGFLCGLYYRNSHTLPTS